VDHGCKAVDVVTRMAKIIVVRLYYRAEQKPVLSRSTSTRRGIM
jgi:hypothetical protein